MYQEFVENSTSNKFSFESQFIFELHCDISKMKNVVCDQYYQKVDLEFIAIEKRNRRVNVNFSGAHLVPLPSSRIDTGYLH